MRSGLPGIRGSIRVRHEGGAEHLYRNLMLISGWNWMLDRLLPTSPAPADLSYIAVGYDDTAPATGQAALISEGGRKVIASQARDGTTIILDVVFERTDCNFHWEEVGLLAGGSAGGGGILVARALLDENKTATRSCAVTWELEAVQL